ncbi:MAG: transposase family protein, partial [Nitrososphaerota archaeon]|nr:transposase family protein [Nitrososphaerota archaeon]
MVDGVSRYEKASKLRSEDFKQLFGAKKETFDVMVDVLKVVYVAKHKQLGRHAKLSIEDQLFLTLKYNRQYLTQKE